MNTVGQWLAQMIFPATTLFVGLRRPRRANSGDPPLSTRPVASPKRKA
ncbi:hypothetical protein SEENP078_08703, partial [Salmonella enterica subsp. enterica serovar Newport str. RI_10P078]